LLAQPPNGRPVDSSASCGDLLAMHELSNSESAALDAALRSDPELEEQLHPLIEGRFGWKARQTVLSCLAARLEQGAVLEGALIPALADALHLARNDFDDV
jgi:hypothetical protein